MLKLYSYFRSSAAYRVRIALNLKGLSYEIIPVHLTRGGGEQRRPEYRDINPQKRVPALAVSGEVLTQSLAIIEYLDETQASRRCCRPTRWCARKCAAWRRRSPAISIRSTI